MQLAWFKSADMYIGQGLVLLKIGHEKTHVFELASTLPIERLLGSCNGLIKAGTNLKITLSNALCSSINVSIPTAIVLTDELQAFLSASAAEQLNASGVSFKCAIDSKNKSLAAAIPSNIFKAIQTWAKEQACSISSIRPMWSIVSQSGECQKTNIKGFVLHEPDGTVLIVQTEKNNLQSLSWHGQLSTDIRKANISRTLVGFDMLAENIQNFHFSAKPRLDKLKSSAVWAEHWSAE